MPTRRLAYALGTAAVIFVAFGPTVGVLAITILLAGTIIDLLMMREAPVVARTVPAVAQRMHPAPLQITAEDPGAGATLVKQPSIPDIRVERQSAADALQTSIVAIRRGRHALPPVAVLSKGRLGFAARTRDVGEPAVVTVYPDVIGARRIARAVATGNLSSAGWRRRGPIGIGTDFESIRDYTPDDDIRHVNWRATLRTGRPMTNSYRIERDRDVICAVDTGRLMLAPIGEATRLDAAVDAVAAVAHTADALGDRSGVVAFDRAVVRSLPPRRRGADGVVEAIHDLEPTPDESNYEIAFRAVAQHKRSLVVVFTDLFEEAAAKPLLEALPVLSRSHAVIVAYVRDDDLRSAVTSPPRVAADAYRAVVALDALAARRTVVARLRHHGVTVVEAPADGLPAAAVAAYLNLKQRAAI